MQFLMRIWIITILLIGVAGCASTTTSTPELNSDTVEEGAETQAILVLPDAWFRDVILVENYLGDGEGLLVLVSALLGLEEPSVIGSGQSTVWVEQGTRPGIMLIEEVARQMLGLAVIQPLSEENRLSVEYHAL